MIASNAQTAGGELTTPAGDDNAGVRHVLCCWIGGEMHWYLDVLKKYWVFTGRACRTEYWMFVLFDVTIATALGGD